MTESKPKASQAILFTAVKWLIAAGLLGGLYWKCGGELAKLKDRHIVWSWFALALGIRLLSLLATFFRWRMLVSGIGVPCSYWDAFRLGMLGEGCSLVGPGAVSGDLVKVALVAKDYPQRAASVFATVFLDRILGVWALFFLGAMASLIPIGSKLSSEMQWAVWALWGGSVAGIIGIGLMFVPAFTHSRFVHSMTSWQFVGKIVKELMDSVQLYQGKPQIVLMAAAMGILGHFGFLTIFYFCALSLHEGQSEQGQIMPGFVEHVVGLPLPEAVSAAVPTPGGIGPLEAGLAWFYEQHQKSAAPESSPEILAAAASNGLLTALGFRLTTWICGAIGIVFYFASKKEIGQVVHDQGADPQPVT